MTEPGVVTAVYLDPKPRLKKKPWVVAIKTSIGFDHKSFSSEDYAKAYAAEHYQSPH